jgi:hypothetical protein
MDFLASDILNRCGARSPQFLLASTGPGRRPRGLPVPADARARITVNSAYPTTAREARPGAMSGQGPTVQARRQQRIGGPPREPHGSPNCTSGSSHRGRGRVRHQL